MKLPILITVSNDLTYFYRGQVTEAFSEKSLLQGAERIIPMAVYNIGGTPLAAGEALTAITNACGTVGASVRAGRDVYLTAGSYGSTGWHTSRDMYPTSTHYLKVTTTKRDGTECTCHVFNATTPNGCNAASCRCGSQQDYSWQTSL